MSRLRRRRIERRCDRGRRGCHETPMLTARPYVGSDRGPWASHGPYVYAVRKEDAARRFSEPVEARPAGLVNDLGGLPSRVRRLSCL